MRDATPTGTDTMKITTEQVHFDADPTWGEPARDMQRIYIDGVLEATIPAGADVAAKVAEITRRIARQKAANENDARGRKLVDAHYRNLRQRGSRRTPVEIWDGDKPTTRI